MADQGGSANPLPGARCFGFVAERQRRVFKSFRENRWAHAVTRVIACPVARTCARTPAQPAAAVPRHRGRRHWQALGLAIGALFLYTSGGTASAATCAPAASAGTAPADWATYCWLDFSSYNDALARSGGQTFTFTLNDGSTLTFVATVTSAAPTALRPVAVPSWSGAAIGNTAFLGIPGKPVLYTATNGSTVTVTFSSMSLTPPAGVTAGSTYSFVAADGESTNQGESLAWTTNGGIWGVLDQVPPIAGNTYPTVTNTGTTFTETGVAGTVGAYIVGSINATQVTTVLVAGGLQGSMFAVRYSTISLNKTLAAGRVNPADQFTYKITATASGTTLGSATSSGTGNGPFTATSSFLTTPQSLTVSEVMAPGSVSTLANYGPSLTCTNANRGSTTPLPMNVATTSYVIPSINFSDAISCLFTNTKLAAVLGVTKSAPSPALKVGVNSTYTLTVTNSGNAAATTAQVKDQLPSNLNFVSASGTNWTCTAAGSLITCQFSGGTIAVGGTSTIAVTVTAPAAAGGASDTNYASIDPTGGNGAPTPGPSCTPASACTSSGPNTVIYINALPESGTATAGTASTPIASAVANDTVNGASATLGLTGNATIAQSGTWPAGVALNTSTGAVTTTATLPPGSYSVTYQLCDRNSPPNCATAIDTVTVTVTASIIPAAQTGAAVAGTASTPIANVAAGGTVNGSPATLGATGNATVAQSGTWPAGIALNTSTGAVTTTAALPPGSYSVTYQLCDRKSPPNCATDTDTVSVTAKIVAVAESGSAVSGIASTPIANVAANDTVNGAAATLGATGNATVATSGTWPSGISLNTTSGAVTIAATVGPGTYAITYQLCDRNTSPNCATATDSVKVSGSALPLAIKGSAVAGIASTPIPNIIAGATVDGAAATLGPAGNATVATVGAWPTGLSLDPTTGAVSTTVALAPGTYPIRYQLCDGLAPPNCAVATDTVTVTALVGGVLLVDKTASTIQAAIGDSVQFRLQVRNAGTATVTDVRLEDTLPLGFKLIAGTVQIGLEPGLPKKAADPQGTPGPALTIVLGNIAPGAILDIYYEVRLGVGADRGNGINQAQALGVGVHSPVATAQVLVTLGAFDTSACVVGKIFVDCNGNRVQDPGEPGIPGVRLYFEDGTNLTSDENGNYSLCGLRPITHALKVDATTLPAGSRLVVLSSRNAGDGNSLFVDLRDGELHRADFAEGSCTNKVMEDVQRRRTRPVLAPLPPAGKEHLGVDFESKQTSSQDPARPGGPTSSDPGERP